MPNEDETYTMGALGRRVYDRANMVTNQAIQMLNPAAAAVEHYIDSQPHPPDWRGAVDDCWVQVEVHLKGIIINAARALAEVESARRQVGYAPG